MHFQGIREPSLLLSILRYHEFRKKKCVQLQVCGTPVESFEGSGNLFGFGSQIRFQEGLWESPRYSQH